MLEIQIKALNESIQANTAMLEKVLAALTSTGDTPQVKAESKAESKAEPKAEPKVEPKVEEVVVPDVKTKAKTVKAKPVTELEPETADIAIDAVTVADLKALAKEAIADGVLRTAIKKLITDAGAETISALDDEQRTEVYNALAKLRGE